VFRLYLLQEQLYLQETAGLSVRELAEKRSAIPDGGEVVATVNGDKIYKLSFDKKCFNMSIHYM